MLQDLYKSIIRGGGTLKQYGFIIFHLQDVLSEIPESVKDDAIDHIIEFLKSQQSPTKM